MTPQKRNFAYAWLGYFFAFNGSVSFYFNSKSGYLEKSRLLKGYKIIHHFATFLMITVLVYGRLTEIKSRYQLWLAGLWLYDTLLIGFLLSCIWCVCRWQNRIYNMFNQLLRLTKQNIVKGYFPSKPQQRHLKHLVYAKLIVNICLLVASCNRIYFNPSFESTILLFLTVFVRMSTENLIFCVMGLISECCCSLQTGLERVLANPFDMRMPNQLDKLEWIEKMHQKLISLVNELSSLFPYVLLGIIMRTIWCSSVLAFFLIRFRFKSSLVLTHVIIGASSVVIDALILYAMANTMSCMLQRTRMILRQASGQRCLIQRSIDFLGLHLSYQDTQVNVFGSFIINHRLVFQSATAILLNVISMVQFDMANDLSAKNPNIDDL